MFTQERISSVDLFTLVHVFRKRNEMRIKTIHIRKRRYHNITQLKR